MLLYNLSQILMPALITGDDLPKLIMIACGALVGLFLVFYILMRILK